MNYITNENHLADKFLQNILLTHQDALFERYSKLLMLRVDFAYRQSSLSFNFADEHQLAAEMTYLMEQCADIPGIVGSAWVMEYTEQHRFHVHAAFYIDGQRHRKVWLFWEQIKHLWEIITEHEGYAHRCEPKPFYRVRGERVVAASDVRGRGGMQYILSYLGKREQRTARPIYRVSSVPVAVRRGRPRR
ncbi:TPA: inovirus-type Gp2 protein [Serratia marcescens]|uniref:inovirus-type Gp2 protein n=1 Tax=Serratia TaxID=613 RepID=UPI0011529E93|nr:MULTISPECIES: inovirus-type Gp2 protein [Serratia]EIY8595552.1 inovirus-type Gp2 protein [Serratia marcescens]EIY8857388.1 inovirus-type Gp2 protein [Serratia marcescens]EIY8864859.1 inovirus-type Gp2 protein [Serratia marcescens]EIY9016877.1 inovirus-type Gp2 protein [Serratia marcescens]ELY3098586.1 inovirus-type Gp2 protein [Serratia marcescens]